MKYLGTLFVLIFVFIKANAQLNNEKKIDTTKYEKVFQVVQIEAEFPGGKSAWAKYLSSNLNAELGNKCIKIPKGQKQAKATAKVVFLVDKTGVISDVSVENAKEIHPELVKEAIRVIKEGPNFIPALQNGKNVAYKARQSITWMVEKD
jgi:protein TonB